MASWISKEEWKVLGRLNLALLRLLRGERSSARLIEKWAREIPDRPAVFFQDRVLSYHELNSLANRVAHHFLGLGARPGRLIDAAEHGKRDTVAGHAGRPAPRQGPFSHTLPAPRRSHSHLGCKRSPNGRRRRRWR